MTERIDHTAEARKILHDAVHDERGRVPEELLDDEEARNLSLWWQEAQIHATLALVEQQLIRNLIALEALHQPRPHSSYLMHNAQTNIDAHQALYRLKPDIAAALGIEEVQS